MDYVSVQLFAPGLDAGGVAARAAFLGDRLMVQTGEQLRWSVAAAELELKSGGYDGRQWLLEWAMPEGRAALLLATGAEPLLANLPAALRETHGVQQRHHERRRRGFRLALAAAGLVLLLPLLLLLGFWLNADRLASWVAERVDPALEQQLGELALAQVSSQLRLTQEGAAAAMVREIGDRLTVGSRYRYRWFVATAPELNAFAMPGGYVVVHAGLLKAADTPEEVAGVLAHEVQHVELRHTLKGMLHGLGWRALLALLLGDLSGGVWGDLAAQLGQLSYGRDLERQADLGGLAALRRAGIAPEGMARFFEKLAHQENARLEVLSTHPATQERLSALRAAIAAQGGYPSQALAYDWPVIQASLP